MAWGCFSLAWLEYSHYGGLACSVGLVYHGLHYSSPGINKPVTKKVEQIIIPWTKMWGWGWRKRRRRSTVRAKLDLGKVVLCTTLSSASRAPQPATPSDLWVHRLGVSELIHVCLFYRSWTLPFHLFMGELAEFSGNNTSHHSFQLQGGKFGVESKMFIRASVTSPN